MSDEAPSTRATDGDTPAELAQEQDAQLTEPTHAPMSAGTLLRESREARGWTIEQVANQLNLAPRQIAALEGDNYSALPGMVIVRGFIRSYAKLLQVDATPILSQLKTETEPAGILPPSRAAMSASFSETRLLSESGRGGSPLRAIAVIVVILLVLGAIVFQGYRAGWKFGSSSEPLAKTSEELPHAVTTETVEPAQVPVADSDASATPSTASASAPQAESPVAGAATPTAAPVANVTAANPSASVRGADDKVSAAPATPGPNALVMKAHQDAWIEIRRADNSVLYSKLLKAETSDAVDINGPVSVVVGNAAGVNITLRGQPVDMTGNASNVARLNLK